MTGHRDETIGAAPDEAIRNAIVWVHGDCLRPGNPALAAAPGAPAIFVFDDALLDDYGTTLKRLVFLYECLLELPVTIRRGDVAEQVLAFAHGHGAERVLTTPSPAPRFLEIGRRLDAEIPLTVVPEIPFLAYDGHLDLRRFSRYWKVAQRYAYGQAGLPLDEDEAPSRARVDGRGGPVG